MKFKIALSLTLVVCSFLRMHAQGRALNKALSNSPIAYAIYDESGKLSSWNRLIEKVKIADVVLFGEFHDDPIVHWLQHELIRDLLDDGIRPVLGAEMLETDDQLVVDEFLEGIINDEKLESSATLWPNHFTDYHPLLLEAREHGLPFIATNIPRRYASLVYQSGLDALGELSAEAKRLFPPLPVPFDISLPGYKAMLSMGGSHSLETFPMAQAIRDATMAHFILNNLNEEGPFIHFNGAYHSQDREGIVWYLQNSDPNLKILTIHSHMQAEVFPPDTNAVGRANFLLITNERMTRTH
tara:strand:- start:374 stop:1267 length:894 start_codon:yes stop_codon:yes gene_type:complete